MSIRVYAFWQNPIFCDSVRLILQHPELEWIGSTTNIQIAQEDLLIHRPEIILIEHTDERTPMEIMQIMEASPWGARLIGMNLNNNHFYLYHREKWTMAKIEDLLQVILSPRNV